ncbi:MAG: hypothetical protein J7501_11490 [Bdellovibrio sp.]|nr:hypothetical protein [Bdellovibrio sp.]
MLLRLILGSLLLTSFAHAESLVGQHFKKVVVIYLENTDYAKAMQQPYLQALSTSGGALDNMYGLTHPSQGNYISFAGGDLLGVRNDNPVNLSESNLADLLEQHGYTWKSYAENFPGNCFPGSVTGRYVRKHNPFISFTNITSNPERCKNIVNSNEFFKDAAAGNLPNLSFYVPNLDDDGHDTGVAYSANWMKQVFDGLLKNPQFMQDTLVVVTFDESSKTGGNHIYTVLLGSNIQPGSHSSQHLTHVNILKTIEAEFNLGDLGRLDKNAEVIQGVWK